MTTSREEDPTTEVVRHNDDATTAGAVTKTDGIPSECSCLLFPSPDITNGGIPHRGRSSVASFKEVFPSEFGPPLTINDNDEETQDQHQQSPQKMGQSGTSLLPPPPPPPLPTQVVMRMTSISPPPPPVSTRKKLSSLSNLAATTARSIGGDKGRDMMMTAAIGNTNPSTSSTTRSSFMDFTDFSSHHSHHHRHHHDDLASLPTQHTKRARGRGRSSRYCHDKDNHELDETETTVPDEPSSSSSDDTSSTDTDSSFQNDERGLSSPSSSSSSCSSSSSSGGCSFFDDSVTAGGNENDIDDDDDDDDWNTSSNRKVTFADEAGIPLQHILRYVPPPPLFYDHKRTASNDENKDYEELVVFVVEPTSKKYECLHVAYRINDSNDNNVRSSQDTLLPIDDLDDDDYHMLSSIIDGPWKPFEWHVQQTLLMSSPSEEEQQQLQEEDALTQSTVLTIDDEMDDDQTESHEGRSNHNREISVADLLDQLPSMATDPLFSNTRYSSLHSVTSNGIDSITTSNKVLLKDCGFSRKQIIVAAMEGQLKEGELNGKDLLRHAANILSNKRLVRKLKKAVRRGQSMNFVHATELSL